MIRFLEKIRTAIALGVPNIARVVVYRYGVRLGLHPVRRLRAAVPTGPFFSTGERLAPLPGDLGRGPECLLLFGWLPLPLSDLPPEWLRSPLDGKPFPRPERNWWDIPDFDESVGDIKPIWELSRMEWVVVFAQQARMGDEGALARLNRWLDSWCAQNPPFRGPNWKCGQEASLRVLNLSVAALILDQKAGIAHGLRNLLTLHLRRIAPTVSYAKAQDNNHGTSEAAALYVGGSWLNLLGVKEALGWQRLGRRMLEERAARLIGENGTFSQYSLNYHRLMLDACCVAEVWRLHSGAPPWSSTVEAKLRGATEWLYQMTDPANGSVPNTGANDGARLLGLAAVGFGDFRPSVQLAETLFCGRHAYAQSGLYDETLKWLKIPYASQSVSPPGDYLADDGGFAVIRSRGAMAMLRYPRFRFRPSQADALHVDLTIAGENLLRDAGTYSYNADSETMRYFGGTAGHNTVQFDERDQMPRLGRFLFGAWLKTSRFEPMARAGDLVQVGAGYRDSRGARHFRRAALGPDYLQVDDEIDGFSKKAVLRWRLAGTGWALSKTAEGLKADRGDRRVTVSASVPIHSGKLVEGLESRSYLSKNVISVLEVEFSEPCSITTNIKWAA